MQEHRIQKGAPTRHAAACDLAEQHLRRLGVTLLARDWLAVGGAVLDLIARDGVGVLVFVDVRDRSAKPVSPARVGVRAYTLRAAADEWEREHRDAPAEAGARNRPRGPRRFDVIAVDLDAEGRLVALDHIEEGG